MALICKSCGAGLSENICPYCGTLNIGPKELEEQTAYAQEILEEIKELELRVQVFQEMAMPESMKQQKIDLLRKKIDELQQ